MVTRNLIIISLLLLFFSCRDSDNRTQEKLHVVCTTNMIGDLVSRIADTSINLSVLMGAGVDPHLYKAAQGDVKKLTTADLIFYNGLHLEGKMGDMLESISQSRRTVALGEQIDSSRLLPLDGFPGQYDPHFWFDPDLWAEAASHICENLVIINPEMESRYRENLRSYQSRLAELKSYIQQNIETIPEKQRILISAHDAFAYFGRAFNIKVKGLQGISTVAEYGLFDIKELSNFIIDNGIKSIFMESSVSPKAMEAVVYGCQEKGHIVQLGGPLYSDALGRADSPEGTYEGMMRANMEMIVAGLK